MVGPMPDEDRESLTRRLKAFFALLIGASAGLITSQGNATPLEVALIALLGTVFGALVVWLVFPGSGGDEPAGR
ncbi:hypothetical protein ACFQPA_02070 [Halomarina halobia]|uniref:Uncharacterized protein n=1 Tax=Halomarina halobia TaxID=3033386 RepID=A0ABD6A3N5_9EURY|nr:hypothetical protein [Halomarina sp. PSR21]